MSEVKLPTIGRTVHYIPVNDAMPEHNNCRRLPAVVVQEWQNTNVNLQVFTMNPDAPNVLRYSVGHISDAPKDQDGNPTVSCWEWPLIS